jgi:hypothetical protein
MLIKTAHAHDRFALALCVIILRNMHGLHGSLLVPQNDCFIGLLLLLFITSCSVREVCSIDLLLYTNYVFARSTSCTKLFQFFEMI